MWVEDIITTLSLEERGHKIGIAVIVNEDNRPKPTQGRVIAVGTDPLIQQEIRVGDIVFFSRLAGTKIMSGSIELRSLEFDEIIGVEQP